MLVTCAACALRAADKALVLGEGSAYEGLLRYRADVYDVMTTYWSMWPPRALEIRVTERGLMSRREMAQIFHYRLGLDWPSAGWAQVDGGEGKLRGCLYSSLCFWEYEN